MLHTAAEIAAAVRSGELDPVWVTEQALARIVAADGIIGAFRRVRAREAVDEAQALAERTDLDQLPLAGVPVAVKDVVPFTGEYAGWGGHARSAQSQPPRTTTSCANYARLVP